MNNEMYDDIALEKKIQQIFDVSLDVSETVSRSIPVSPTAHATVFITSRKQLFVYVDGQSRFLLKDVKTIISRMGLVAEMFFPPAGNKRYFDDYGADRYKEVFPNMPHPKDNDLMYYRTLAPYRPALVLIKKTKDGVIYQYDRDSKTSWRPVAEFEYRRINPSV
jgi:hypothetical protein